MNGGLGGEAAGVAVIGIGAGAGRLVPSNRAGARVLDGPAESTWGKERMIRGIGLEPPAPVIAFGRTAHAGKGMDEKPAKRRR